MLDLFRPASPAIGLDVGVESVKMLQLCGSADGLKVAAAVRVPIPADAKGKPDARVAFVAETLRAAFRKKTFAGRRVVAALPKELLHYKTHRVADVPAEVDMAARIDARDLFRFDPDSAEFRCLDAGPIKQGIDSRREVILVAAGRQYVDGFVRALHGAGARVQSLGIDPCAVWRAATRGTAADPAAPPRVLLDIGAAQSRLIIGHADGIRVIRTIDVGADHVRTAISRTMGLSVEEAEQLRRRSEKLDGARKVLNDATRHVTDLLAREVLAGVRYHAVTFRGAAPKRVELLGGDANDAQVRAILTATLMLPAKPFDVFRGIDATAIANSDHTESFGEWAVALGLALKGFDGQPQPAPVCDVASAKPQPPAAAAEVAHA